MTNSFAAARQNMIDSQIKPFSVTDLPILAAFGSVKREDFVPVDRQGLAYLGEELPMSEDRFLVEPPAYARLLQSAGLQSDHIVLDVGTLMGYTAAILSSLVKAVVAVDEAAWISKAQKAAAKADKHNIVFVTDELTSGASQHGPYDVILINGAVQVIPQALVNQLKDGGKIATFFRSDTGNCHAVLYHKHKGDLRKQIIFDAFVPMLRAFEKTEGFVF